MSNTPSILPADKREKSREGEGPEQSKVVEMTDFSFKPIYLPAAKLWALLATGDSRSVK